MGRGGEEGWGPEVELIEPLFSGVLVMTAKQSVLIFYQTPC